LKSSQKKKNRTCQHHPIDSIHIKEKSIDGLTKIGLISQGKNDTLKKTLDGTNEINSKIILNLGLENIAKMDSLRKKGFKNITANSIKYQFIKKLLKIEEEQTKEEIFKDFSIAFNLNLPEVLFIYMPVFAFILWLFHNKRKGIILTTESLHFITFLFCYL
jgi:hypothetical protein